MLNIDNLHRRVKTKIDANVSGYAQAFIDEVKVSYDGKGFSSGPDLFPEIPDAHVRDVIYGQFAFAIATGKGEATADVFSEARLARLADDAARSNDDKKRKFAEVIEAFYLKPGGAGVFMVR